MKSVNPASLLPTNIEIAIDDVVGRFPHINKNDFILKMYNAILLIDETVVRYKEKLQTQTEYDNIVDAIRNSGPNAYDQFIAGISFESRKVIGEQVSNPRKNEFSTDKHHKSHFNKKARIYFQALFKEFDIFDERGTYSESNPLWVLMVEVYKYFNREVNGARNIFL